MKKIVSVIMVVVMLFSCAVISSSAADTDNALRFNEDGKFKILLIADMQDGYPIKSAYIAYISETLDKTQPDLVVFLGDNVMDADTGFKESAYYKAFNQALDPIVSRGIPFTLVFGNHDREYSPGLTQEQILAEYQKFDGCLAYDPVPSLHGCATHNLEILSSDGSKTAFNLWMMDCGDYCSTGYDCVRRDQIEWYKSVSKELERKNDGELVPSLMFQHIVPEEVAKKVMKPATGEEGEELMGFVDGTYVSRKPAYSEFTGNCLETPCPSAENEGEWDAITERGDVMAMFFGHDHKNSYKTNINGVDALNVPGASYSSYKSFIEQGTMLVTLDENDPWSYDTQMIFATDIALTPGSHVPYKSFIPKTYYLIQKISRIVYNGLIRPLIQVFDK
ncbi:MAG: metallophosphoesterase [Clostridia bacterium]|nr:metallophosphoesterase [Clostridia bacterium]